MAEEQQQDVETLKRRGRRRLVGAVALVLAAVIVLPMVFDPEPRGTAPVSVRIPGEDETPFAPKPPPKKPEPVKKEEFVVQVGAFSDEALARATRSKIEKLGLKAYTQVVDTGSGKRIRVRVGPFDSRDDADKAAGKIKSAGLSSAILAL